MLKFVTWRTIRIHPSPRQCAYFSSALTYHPLAAAQNKPIDFGSTVPNIYTLLAVVARVYALFCVYQTHTAPLNARHKKKHLGRDKSKLVKTQTFDVCFYILLTAAKGTELRNCVIKIRRAPF